MWRIWLPPVAYAVLIFYLSSIRDLTPPVDVGNADKVAHFLEYGGFGLLLFRSAWIQWPGAGRRAWVFAVGLGALIAMADEIFQGTVGRQRSFWDWVADVTGLSVAAYLAHRIATGSLRLPGRKARPPAAPSRDDRHSGS